jgi:hypothetical protein
LRNANIPLDHANLQGTTVNQSTITTPKASHTATIIRRTSWPRSPLTRALHAIADNLGVIFQIDRTSIPSRRSRETQFRSSASANGTHDLTAGHRPMSLITATSNPMSVELRKCPQSNALTDSLIPHHGYSNLANRQLIVAKSILQMQPTQLDISPHGP